MELPGGDRPEGPCAGAPAGRAPQPPRTPREEAVLGVGPRIAGGPPPPPRSLLSRGLNFPEQKQASPLGVVAVPDSESTTVTKALSLGTGRLGWRAPQQQLTETLPCLPGLRLVSLT